jgi:hypothetical protein
LVPITLVDLQKICNRSPVAQSLGRKVGPWTREGYGAAGGGMMWALGTWVLLVMMQRHVRAAALLLVCSMLGTKHRPGPFTPRARSLA